MASTGSTYSLITLSTIQYHVDPLASLTLSRRHSYCSQASMDSGSSSRSNTSDDDRHRILVWAKLVPADSRYPAVEIKSREMIVFSEITSSSPARKEGWCEIRRGSDDGSATIRSLSSSPILVNGLVVGEEAVDIKNGSEITSGPNRDGYLTYIFEEIQIHDHDRNRLKISLDAEHAKCSICLNVWHDVVTVAPCLHNFCNGCFSEWLRRYSKGPYDHRHNVVCPQCRAVVHSVGRNHFLRNIEEAILQTFSSLKRSDEEIALLETYSSIKTNIVLGTQKNPSRKRPWTPSAHQNPDMDLPCPQCGTEFGGFRCNRNSTHLQCDRCRGMMPSRPDFGVPQKCIGCDRAFCGAYWSSQGLDASDYNIICPPETLKPISNHVVYRIPDSVHNNNRYERDVTVKCIEHSGKSVQDLISEWIMKFSNNEIDRMQLELNHKESITSATYLCSDCHTKFVDYLLYWYRVTLPTHLLPPDASERDNCWYGYQCRTQQHNEDHARKRNHVCRPTRGHTST